MDSIDFTCARLPFLLRLPWLTRSAPLMFVIDLTPVMVPKLFSEETLEKWGHELNEGALPIFATAPLLPEPEDAIMGC